MPPPGVAGNVAYMLTVGLGPAGLWMRQTDGLSMPPPVQLSSKNRSPLSGSTASPLGQGKPDATVRSTAPVAGSIWTMLLGLKWVPYKRPSLPKTRLPNVGPRVESRFALETAPPVAGWV